MRCLICGRLLKKSNGPIGPTCSKKKNKNTRAKKTKQFLMFDIFAEVK